MKRILLGAAASSLALLFCIPVLPASAQTEATYARITEESTWLYESPDLSTGLFILPQTYFVRVTGTTGEYCAVVYLENTQDRSAVYGYCLQDKLTIVDYQPETPYLVYDVTVTYNAGDGLPDSFISQYVVTAAFYGTYPYGSSAGYYVELDGAFGYVPSSACSALAYAPNTEYESETEPAVESNSSKSGGTSSAVGIVLVCALAVVALGGVYFLFRPVKIRKPTGEDAEDVF